MKRLRLLIKTNSIFFHILCITVIFCAFFTTACYIFIYPNSDIYLYNLYAKHFLYGNPPTPSFSLYPREYPFLTLLIFIPPLLSPLPYLFSFMLLLFLCLIGIYLYLFTYVSHKEALWFLAFTLLGAGAVVLLRFDIVPSLCVFGMIISRKKSYLLSYLFLLLGIGFKIYPIILLPFLFLDHLATESTKRAFVAVTTTLLGIVVVTFLQIYLSQGTSVFDYFLTRPVQIESVQASTLWLVSLATQQPFTILFSFTSYNFISPNHLLSVLVSGMFWGILLCGYGLLVYLFYRKRITFVATCLGALLLLLSTAKVFSPQYLLWIIPIVSLVDLKTVHQRILFLFICILTSLIYPVLYVLFINTPLFYIFMTTVVVRNILLVLFSISFMRSTFGSSPKKY